MRVLGLDYGSKTIGVAVSDPMGWTAQALEVIRRPNPLDLVESLSRIGELLREYSCGIVVLGLPLGLDGTAGENCEKIFQFKARLEKSFGITVLLEDERMTSVLAGQAIYDSGARGRKREKIHKQAVDKIAAVYILQSYLDKSNRNKNYNEEVY